MCKNKGKANRDKLYINWSMTLNGRTIFIKAHSINNNTIYIYKYNLLN
jgi:hypothetical protein